MKSPTNKIQMYDMWCTYEILLSIKIKGWSVEILFSFAKSSDVSEVCSSLCKARDFFKNPFIRFADAPHWQVCMRWGDGGLGEGRLLQLPVDRFFWIRDWKSTRLEHTIIFRKLVRQSTKNLRSVYYLNHDFLDKRGLISLVIDRLFYSCGLSYLAFEWMWGWRWPCFDGNLLCFVMDVVLEKYLLA